MPGSSKSPAKKKHETGPSLEKNLAGEACANFVPRDKWLGWTCFGGIIALAFLMSFHTLTDTDIFWHLKTGEIIFQTHKVPRYDLFSFTVAGKEWIDAQWLFQLMIYLLYHFFGYGGMILWGALLSGFTWAFIVGTRFRVKRYFIMSLVGLISLLSISNRLKLRPELLTFFYISLELFFLDLFHRGKKFALYFLPVLFLLWLNSEGLWPIYFALLGAFFFEELLLFFWPSLGRWFFKKSRFSAQESVHSLGLVLLVSLVLVFFNPYSWRGAVFPLVLLRETAHPESAVRNLIFEFQNPFLSLPILEKFAYTSLIAFSGLFFLILLLNRRIYFAYFLLWLVFLYISSVAVRNVALFGVVTCALLLKMLLENPFSEILPWPKLTNLVRFRWIGGLILLGCIIALGIDIISSKFFLRNRSRARFGIGALETEYPIRAGNFLKKILEKENLKELKIFADAESAGYLIWVGYPDWKVYFDPRLEVYGEEFLKHFVAVLDRVSVFEQESKIYDFDVVVLDHLIFRLPLILHLYQDPDWALVYLDGLNVVFLHGTDRLEAVITRHEIDFQKGFEPAPVPAGLRGAWRIDELKNRGILLMMLHQPESALPFLQELIKLAPKDSEANYYLGWALHRLKQFSEAKFYLEKAVALDPEAVPPQIQLAQVYAMTGEVERSVQLFHQLLQRHPEEITICINLAQVYEMILQSEDSEAQWQRCWEIYQTNPARYEYARAEIIQALERLRSKK